MFLGGRLPAAWCGRRHEVFTGMSVRCRVSGKTPSTALCARLVGRVCGVGGLFFLLGAGCLPATVVVVGVVSGGVV